MLNNDLRKLKQEINIKKNRKLSKVLESDKIDSIIEKTQNLYHKITNKLIVKYNLEDELKQGKIFTILIALITFIMLIILSTFFAITLNSIIGIGLIFSFIRQIVFCLNLGYTIIKNKGSIIKRYLSNLFPNSRVLKEEKDRRNIPLYEEAILYQIEDFIEELNKSNIDLEIEKDITLRLKSIVESLNIKSLDFKDEIKSLEEKQRIQKELTEIYFLFQNSIIKKERKEDFLDLKNDVLEQINEVDSKVYVKKRT